MILNSDAVILRTLIRSMERRAGARELSREDVEEIRRGATVIQEATEKILRRSGGIP